MPIGPYQAQPLAVRLVDVGMQTPEQEQMLFGVCPLSGAERVNWYHEFSQKEGLPP